MGFPHRCSKCGHRKTLAKKWEEYIKPPKCESCGHARLYFCKDRMPSRWGKKHACNCDGYWFKHRKGSKWCENNPNLEQLYEQEERHVYI